MAPVKLLLLSLWMTCAPVIGIWSQSTVTFQLTTDSINESRRDTLLNIGIRGNIAPLTWAKGIKMIDADKNGIYSANVRFDIEKETTLYFKYVLNETEWEAGDARKIALSPNEEAVSASNFNYVNRPGNPFKKFIGQWTLKDDNWEQNNGNGIEKVKIPNHHTLIKEVNTDTSILQIVDATSAKGHILWVYDHMKKEVQHVSSFYPFRSGTGKGSIDEEGNVRLKIEFEGEPEGTYRIYDYSWINTNEYSLLSTQYDETDTPTGNFYGGSFIRMDKKNTFHQDDYSERGDKVAITAILSILDNNSTDIEKKLEVWVDDLTHMAPDYPTITNKFDLRAHLKEQSSYGFSDMKHEIIEVHSYADLVLMHGKVTGTFFPASKENPVAFTTKNLFVFRRLSDQSLKIWKVIFNRTK